VAYEGFFIPLADPSELLPYLRALRNRSPSGVDSAQSFFANFTYGATGFCQQNKNGLRQRQRCRSVLASGLIQDCLLLFWVLARPFEREFLCQSCKPTRVLVRDNGFDSEYCGL